jgi:hypothetical protein
VQDVEASVERDGRLDQCHDGSLVAHVHLQRGGTPALAFDVGSLPLRGRQINVGNDDTGALPRERQCTRGTDAPACASHQRNPSFDSTGSAHDYVPQSAV